ncbi:hypothetical protein BWD09_10995 [Neisseria dentiae]|uniref:Uncharacterized protein n=1 Tax=Neisseria dentiae TaxID=194197 RepID=A0A1X3D2Y3_9NEIS|nr:hypothetical protein [Neisseria dentiae]OSI14273.1 hypothetical protein BWD09_10995 [Neisseria dentiae]QMT44735.1 hypothetical protein H3L92_09845 [Neisseria dentiae]STZ50454.1 Uncharacterised protein [Neisseria dentiae]
MCNTIGGFVARQADTGHLAGQDLKQTIDNFALDYKKWDGSDSDFVQALGKGENRYLLFEGRLTEPKQSEIPRGEKFGGDYHTAPPCTLNGFIACRSDEILPEFFIKETEDTKQYPEHGSTIWVVEDGVKRKAAVYDEENERFIPYVNK